MMTELKKEDFIGCGQYIIKCDYWDKLSWWEKLKRPGNLSTIIYKIGWGFDNHTTKKYCMISMSDGWIHPVGDSYQEIIDELKHRRNNYRFATAKEVRRVIKYQKKYPRVK